MTEHPEAPVGPKIYRDGRPWAIEKLELLRYYLGGRGYKGGGFMMATRRAGARYYIDLFAGAGQGMLDGDVFDGSPLIATKADPPFTRLVWADADARNAASLRAHRADYLARRIDVYHGDANVEVGAVLAGLPRTDPTIAFLDPEGSELHWSTVEKLAAHKPGHKIEQLILFAYNMGIVRFMPRDPTRLVHDDKLDRMMPSQSGWRSMYAQRGQVSPSEYRRLMLQEYVNGLRDLGYHHVPDPRLIPTPNGRPLYFMVFATDHTAGSSIMRAAFERVTSTRAQTSFLPYDQRY